MKYKILVKFKRTFTRGNLKGITVEDSIKHIDMNRAISWVENVGSEFYDFEFVNL